MRILFLTAAVQGKSSTAVIHSREIAENLCKSHSILLIGQKEYEISARENLHFRQVSTLPVTNMLIHRITLPFLTFVNSCVAISAFKPNVIYLRHGVNSVITVVLSKLFRIPFVLEVNSLFQEEQKLRTKNKFASFIIRFIEVLAFRNSSAITPVTAGLKKTLQSEYGIPSQKITVISNGANTDLFKPINQLTARSIIGLDDNCNFVCFVGARYQSVPWYGIETLIASSKLIVKEFPNTKFLIIGGGPFKEKIIKLIAETNLIDHFMLVGNIPYKAVPEYVSASDICVAPYSLGVLKKTGVSPLTLYEYLSCEKPVVASNFEGMGDLLDSVYAGIPVKPGDVDEFGKAIIFLLKNKKIREIMGKNGRKEILKYYSWSGVANRLTEVLYQTEKSKRVLIH